MDNGEGGWREMATGENIYRGHDARINLVGDHVSMCEDEVHEVEASWK